MLGKKIEIKRANEPSNYIWENMAYTKSEQRITTAVVLAILSIVLFIGYTVQFELTQTITNSDKFETFDCELFERSIPQGRLFDIFDMTGAHMSGETYSMVKSLDK